MRDRYARARADACSPARPAGLSCMRVWHICTWAGRLNDQLEPPRTHMKNHLTIIPLLNYDVGCCQLMSAPGRAGPIT